MYKIILCNLGRNCRNIRQSKCGAVYKKKIVSLTFVRLQVLNHKYQINLEKKEKKIKEQIIQEQIENNETIFKSHYNWKKINEKWIID
jgi:hypothetical protein